MSSLIYGMLAIIMVGLLAVVFFLLLPLSIRFGRKILEDRRRKSLEKIKIEIEAEQAKREGEIIRKIHAELGRGIVQRSAIMGYGGITAEDLDRQQEELRSFFLDKPSADKRKTCLQTKVAIVMLLLIIVACAVFCAFYIR